MSLSTALRFVCPLSFLITGQITLAEVPILTDEFDAFLVTRETSIGEVVGTIRPVFPNDKKISWSLLKPIPGGDRRNYLKAGQADATEIVSIDSESGELRLIKSPDAYPEEFYAEVRATNEDGYMEQVLIIIARENTRRPNMHSTCLRSDGKRPG